MQNKNMEAQVQMTAPTSERQVYFLGLTQVRRSDWDHYVVEPIATRSSKPESVAKEIAEKKAAQEEQAGFWPVTSTVTSVVILDQNGTQCFTAASGINGHIGEVSYRTLQYLHDVLDLTGSHACSHDLGINLYGLKIRDRLRTLAMDALYYVTQRAKAGERYAQIPVGLWYNRPFAPTIWADPFDVLLPTENRQNFSWESIANFLSIPQFHDPATIDENPVMQADVARQLALAAGMVTI